MAARNIKDELVAIPGVADAEVTLSGNAAPVARIWLDGSRDSAEVREKVESLLGSQVPSAGVAAGAPQRRTGLGKSFETIMPDDDAERVPTQLKAQTENRAVSVTRVAVVESSSAVSVEIEDGAGNVYTADVGPGGSIDRAVLDAAAALSGASADVLFGLADAEIDGIAHVVVSASVAGRRSAGASPVEFGRPFAVARATRQALESL